MMPLREAVNRLFEESFLGPRFALLTPRTFLVDIYESEDKLHYVIEAALPGFKPEELHIKVVGDTLTISAIKKEGEKREKELYIATHDNILSRTCLLEKDKLQQEQST